MGNILSLKILEMLLKQTLGFKVKIKALSREEAHLGVFYLQLSHLYEVLPEGQDSSALEAGEFWKNSATQTGYTILQHVKAAQTRFSFLPHKRADLSFQTPRACRTSAGTAAAPPPPGGCLCSLVEPYPRLCWRSRSPLTPGLAGTEGPERHLSTFIRIFKKCSSTPNKTQPSKVCEKNIPVDISSVLI